MRKRYLLIGVVVLFSALTTMALRFFGPSLRPISDAYTTNITESAFRLIEEENIDHYAVALLLQNVGADGTNALNSHIQRAVLALRIKLFFPSPQVHAFILENAPYAPTITGLKAAATVCFDTEVGDMIAADEATLIVQMRAPYRDWSRHEAALLDARNRLLARTFPEQATDGALTTKISTALDYCQIE